jgi:hypothetical protein
MSNTDLLRTSESVLLPPGYLQDHIFELHVDGYHGRAEVDGYHPVSREAIEICQSESIGGSPKPGQKRKMAADVLKLIFLRDIGLITRGRVYVTSQAMYDWSQQTGSWLNAARKKYGIVVELRGHSSKLLRKKIRNAMKRARRAG